MPWWGWMLLGAVVACVPVCGVPILPALIAKLAMRMRII